jgi:DNA polymerase-3 subunit beta
MKFIISSQSLLKKLQSIAGVLNSSNTLPILDNFLFEIKDQILTVSCSDLESTITSILPIDAKSEGSVAIPAKILIDILKTFPDHPLTFSIDEKMGIEISSDYGKYKLSGYNGEEFPKSPIIESPSTVSLSGFILQRAIEKTIFASGNDDLRPVMSGVFIQLS